MADITQNDQLRCPVCKHPSGVYRQDLGGEFSLIKCPDCGLEYVDPMPGQEQLRLFYADYQDVRASQEVVERNARLHLKFLKEHGWTKDQATLDFGCGHGDFVRAAGHACYGMEFQPGSHERVVSRLDELPEHPWPFVSMWGVLEHLPDPEEILKRLAKIQPTGGILALTTVDAEGSIPYHYKPPEHLTYWTRNALNILARKCGYEVVDIHAYQMVQLSRVYLDRLLVRTPEQYRGKICATLPEFITVPTNEFRALLRMP